MPPGRLRPAGPGRADAARRPARGPGRRRGHHAAVAVRPQPALRLRRPVRLRGRLPHRRASRRRALPRPGPARRAARPRRAPRAARPRGAGRGRGRAPAAGAGPQGPRRRGGRRPDAAARTAHHGRGRRPGRGRRRRRRLVWPPWPTSGASSRSGWPATSAGSPIEDVGRLRDGLGVPVPPGTPDVFTEPVEDPLGDLVARYARTHGPFTSDEVAARLGLGAAVVRQTLQRLGAQGRVLDGEFRPSGTGASGLEWCDAEVLRKLRRRSLARLRKEVEPVEPESLGRFLTAWQHVQGSGGPRSGPRGADGVLTVVDQLAGCPVPASALESLILPARVRDYEPAHLDELTSSGEVLWAGHGALPGADGWLSLHLADQAHAHPAASCSVRALRAAPVDPRRPVARWRLLLPPALRRRRLHRRRRPVRLRCGTWSGPAGSATTPSPRSGPSPGRVPSTHRTRRPAPRVRTTGGRSRMPIRTGPPDTAGRWSLLPEIDPDVTRRAHAAAEGLLARHGVVIRGAVMSERVARRLRRDLQGALDLRGVGPLPPGLLRQRARRRPVRHRRRDRPVAHLRRARPRRQAGRDRARRDRPGQPVRRSVALAGLDHRGQRPPAGPQGRRDGGAGRRRADALRRARRAHPAHLDRRPRRCWARPPSPSPRPPVAASSAGSRSRRPTASSCSAPGPRRCARRCRPPASSPRPKGLRLRA